MDSLGAERPSTLRGAVCRRKPGGGRAGDDRGRPAHHTVCFLCQSAAEKYLKGYLIAQGWDLEKTHDLVALLTRCADYEDSFAALREGGAVLNEYIVAGRYPGDLAHEEIGDVEAAEAVSIARRIEEKVRSKIEEG